MSTLVWRVEHFDDIDSTNNYVAAAARAGAHEGLVALADFQSAGRGRLDRTWEAPARSSLLCSILLTPRLEVADAQLCVIAVALAARRALVRLSGVRPELKWPNDLVVDDKKLAGLLAEVVVVASRPCVVVGLGLNLTFRGPAGVEATSVFEASGLTIAPRALLDLVLEELEERRVQLDSDDTRAALRAEYSSALSTLGRRVRVEQHGGDLVGTAIGVDDHGRLLVDVEGVVSAVGAGDVVHLRVERAAP